MVEYDEGHQERFLRIGSLITLRAGSWGCRIYVRWLHISSAANWFFEKRYRDLRRANCANCATGNPKKRTPPHTCGRGEL